MRFKKMISIMKCGGSIEIEKKIWKSNMGAQARFKRCMIYFRKKLSGQEPTFWSHCSRHGPPIIVFNVKQLWRCWSGEVPNGLQKHGECQYHWIKRIIFNNSLTKVYFSGGVSRHQYCHSCWSGCRTCQVSGQIRNDSGENSFFNCHRLSHVCVLHKQRASI